MKRSALLVTSVILASIPFFAIHSQNEFYTTNPLNNNQEFSMEEGGGSAISGHSFLNFSTQISPMSMVNASWFADITVLDSYGVEFLENRSMGLRFQIDSSLGNSDNWLSQGEIDAFATLAKSKLNWTEAGRNICCLLDEVEFLPSGQQHISVTPPTVGSVDLQNSTWSWSESTLLRGLTDGRTQRILDLSRIGEIVEEVPMTVILPEDWEIKFSPMSEIISGSPRNFTVHRSLAPVAYDIRILIGENDPPSIFTQRFPNTMAHVSLDKTTSLTASCTDGLLETPEVSWTVKKNDSVVRTEDSRFLDINPLEYDFSHGESITFSAICADSHGTESASTETLTIDSISPTWSWEISTTDGTSTFILENIDGIIEVPSGWDILVKVNSSDNSDLPVKIRLISNISDGWQKVGINQKDFQFTVNQGIWVNGAHLSPYDRHQQKEETMFGMTLQLEDDAGNTAVENWQIRVADTMHPTIIMKLSSGGIEQDLDEGIHFLDPINATLIESFDDIDSIHLLSWGVSIDGSIIFEDVNWSQIENFALPEMDVGTHELHIWAIDSSGNRADSTFPVHINPKIGVNLSIAGVEILSSESDEKDSSVMVTVQNEGFDGAILRLCTIDSCSRFYEIPGATIESRSTSVQLQFDLEISNSSVEGITLHWESVSSSEFGQIPVEKEFLKENQTNQINNNLILLLIIGVSALAVFSRRGNLEK